MKRIFLVILVTLVIIGGILNNSLAQVAPPGIKASLALYKTAYLLNAEPIKATITLENISDGDVITSGGFTISPFHLYLVFIDPDGKGITAPELGTTEKEGPPPQVIPVGGELIQVESVEVLPGPPDTTWVLSLPLPDARAYYTLTKAGKYSVKALIPMKTYPAISYTVAGIDYAAIDSFNFAGAIESNTVNFSLVADEDVDGYSYPEALSPYASFPDCDDNNPAVNPGATELPGNGIDEDCNPATSDVVIIPPGTIIVKADKHTVGSGNLPSSTKVPIAGLLVRIFDKSAGSCVSNFGVSWKNYKSIWLSCFSLRNEIGTTGADGTVSITVKPGDYIVIGEYDPNVSTTGDEIYIGVSAGNLTSGATMQKYLQVIVKADGKTVPAKYTVKTGSELLIIEPEYVEWSGTQELYPFVFESIGDWTVNVSVSPPGGFVADYNNLATDVNTTLKSVQFTVTDIGSEWVSTGVTYMIKHKGKSEVVKSQIGVKLSERLAKAKGLNRFGGKEKKGSGK